MTGGRLIRVVGAMIYYAVHWLLFSVVLGLFAVWIELVYRLVTGDSSRLPNALCANLLNFSIVLVFVSYGSYYYQIDMRKYRWTGLFAVGYAFIAITGCTLIYWLIITGRYANIVGLPTVTTVSWFMCGGAVFYGLALTLSARMAEER